MSKPRILTSYWLKPIPDRSRDWECFAPDYDPDASGALSIIGYGPTEEAAIDDYWQDYDLYYDTEYANLDCNGRDDR